MKESKAGLCYFFSFRVFPEILSLKFVPKSTKNHRAPSEREASEQQRPDLQTTPGHNRRPARTTGGNNAPERPLRKNRESAKTKEKEELKKEHEKGGKKREKINEGKKSENRKIIENVRGAY